MENKMIGNGWRVSGIILAFVSVIPLITGLYKMFAYENGESYPYDMVNAYVGGDAYNYIINANYATAYFVLAGILILSAIGCGILYHLTKMTHHPEAVIEEIYELEQKQEEITE